MFEIEFRELALAEFKQKKTYHNTHFFASFKKFQVIKTQ